MVKSHGYSNHDEDINLSKSVDNKMYPDFLGCIFYIYILSGDFYLICSIFYLLSKKTFISNISQCHNFPLLVSVIIFNRGDNQVGIFFHQLL